LRKEFPKRLSYQHFVELTPTEWTDCICSVDRQQRRAVHSSIPRPCRCVTIVALDDTRSLRSWQIEAKPLCAGFMASNCIWWSITRENISLSASRRAMSMTATLILGYLPGFVVNRLVADAASHGLFSDNVLPRVFS